ncbi:MAG: hypothetical protein R6W73_09270 [Candidatus Saliniplasma sp.]
MEVEVLIYNALTALKPKLLPFFLFFNKHLLDDILAARNYVEHEGITPFDTVYLVKAGEDFGKMNPFK